MYDRTYLLRYLNVSDFQSYRNSGVLKAVLKAFVVPYSKENTMLAYKPRQFVNHLDRLKKQTGANRDTLQSTISRAKRAGLLKVDESGNLVTTWRGRIKVRVKPPTQTEGYLVIIFDVPESLRKQRDLLRAYLQSTYCEPVQKSVWKTRYDIHQELNEVIIDLGLEKYVTQFIAKEI